MRTIFKMTRRGITMYCVTVVQTALIAFGNIGGKGGTSFQGRLCLRKIENGLLVYEGTTASDS